MLDIQTFDARAGGNVLYKAFAHPLAAEAVARLAERLRAAGSLAVYDPDGVCAALWALHPSMPAAAESYVHDVAHIGQDRAGVAARPLVDLPRSQAAALLIAAFDAGRVRARIAHMVPAGMEVVTLDEARLPPAMLSAPGRYLDRLNFATNYAFFRDTGDRGGTGCTRGLSRPTTGRATARSRCGCGCGCSAGTARCWRSGRRRCPPAPAASPSTAGRSAPASACRRSPGSCLFTPSASPGMTW